MDGELDYDKGYDKGYEAGYEAGYEEGYMDGRACKVTIHDYPRVHSLLTAAETDSLRRILDAVEELNPDTIALAAEALARIVRSEFPWRV